MNDPKTSILESSIKAGGAIVAVIVLGYVFLRLGEKMLDNQAASTALMERQVAADEKDAAAAANLAQSVETFLLIWRGAIPANP